MPSISIKLNNDDKDDGRRSIEQPLLQKHSNTKYPSPTEKKEAPVNPHRSTPTKTEPHALAPIPPSRRRSRPPGAHPHR